jgi:hypothetical protein
MQDYHNALQIFNFFFKPSNYFLKNIEKLFSSISYTSEWYPVKVMGSPLQFQVLKHI